ncbi:hypothetical protein [uncultured Tenacibaculum sp.]|uniref:hypothetical protein n=1 Tax=uncultured Tenacibaculum sp. TaxID=174713 RepID=UPI00262BEC09|nr:hypothetical protein [uncultured Tenacibaculum sp.]
MKPKLIAIGYWKSIYEPELPDPANFIDLNWNTNEKNIVLQHLKKGKPIAQWMGTSWCRYRCKENDMGASCLTDGKYIYPEKLSHYINKHNVRLPDTFIKHILNYKPLNILADLNNYDVDYELWRKELGFNNTPNVNTYLALTDDEIEKFNERKKADNNI